MVSKKNARKLTVLANRASKLAQEHTVAAQKFWDALSEITGSDCDSSHMSCGADDPIVDIVDYGRGSTNIGEMMQLVEDLIKDDRTLRGEG